MLNIDKIETVYIVLDSTLYCYKLIKKKQIILLSL